MSRVFSLKLVADDPEIEQRLESLADNHNLHTFVKLAVNAYFTSPEGERVSKVLCGAKKQKKVNKATQRNTSIVSGEDASECVSASVPVKPMVVAATLPSNTDDVMRRIFATQ